MNWLVIGCVVSIACAAFSLGMSVALIVTRR